MKKLLITLLLICNVSFAQNYGWETGNLSDWMVGGGSTSTIKNTWDSNGVGVAVTTGVTDFNPGGGKNWNINPYGSYMGSLQPGNGSVAFDSAVSSLGLNSTENTSIKNYLSLQASSGGGGNPNPTNATWIKQNVNLIAGTTYKIAWNYLSTDYTPFNDGSMMTLVHATDSSKIPTLNNSQQRFALLGFTNPGTGNYATGSYGSTGWQVAVFTVPESGNYVLGFSSFNLGDTSLSPILFVDQIQGTTTLNGTSFDPVAPNPGSTAPSTPPPTSYSATITSDQQARINAARARQTYKSEINIEQIGNYNNIDVVQSGFYHLVDVTVSGDSNIVDLAQSGIKNYTRIQLQGSSNSVNSFQSNSGGLTPGHFSEIIVAGNNNNIINSQMGDGEKITFISVNGNINSISNNQSGSGTKYSDLKTIGSGHSIVLEQKDFGQHAARIEITNNGGASTINVTQQGNVNQTYSIQQSCATVGGCAVTMTQQ
jgi:hypothetical protein